VTTEITKSDESGRKSLIELVGSNVTVITAALLTLSVAYDWSFLVGVGLTPSEVPTTLQDHLRSAVVWAPGTVLLLFFGFVVNVVMGSSEHNKPKGNAKKGISGVWFSIGIIDVGYQAAIFFGILIWGSLYTLLVHHRSWAVISASAVGWVLVCSFLLEKVEFREQFALYGGRGAFFVVAPLLMAMVIGLGRFSGEMLMRGHAEVRWAVTIKKGEIEQLRLAVGIRRFSEFVLLVDSDSQVEVIPSSSLISARLLDQETKGTLCTLFGIQCVSLPQRVLPAKAASAPAPASSTSRTL